MKTFVPIFTGQIDAQGELHLTPAEAAQRLRWRQSLAGQSVEVVIRKRREHSSERQKRYLHTVPIPILADYFGEDHETTKLLILGSKFGWRETRDGHRVPVKPSITALTVEETSDLIEWLPPWALLEFGVDVPLPKKAEAA